jgi:hypothetical protein
MVNNYVPCLINICVRFNKYIIYVNDYVSRLNFKKLYYLVDAKSFRAINCVLMWNKKANKKKFFWTTHQINSKSLFGNCIKANK